jgi:hypothetical protein
MTIEDVTPHGSTRRVTVTKGRHGWEVTERHGDQIVRRAHYTDWHRLERAIGLHQADAASQPVEPSSGADVESR